MSPIEAAAALDDDQTRRPGDYATGRHDLRQLIQLRWIAVLGQVVTIFLAIVVFQLPLPLKSMIVVLAALVGFNLFSRLRLHLRIPVSQAELFLALLLDVLALTAQLYLSGGPTNPFIFLFLLQVTLAAVLLRPLPSWIIVVLSTVAFIGLGLTSQDFALPLELGRGLSSPFILGMLVCFVLNAILIVIFISRITRNVRSRDARLADMRQRASEEEHIVHMGLLASGAAHELGTPLATLDVILGDWSHAPPFRDDPELAQDVREMQAQVRRCKAIVSGILMSAGEARGEAPTETSVHAFLDELVAQWRVSRQSAHLDYENRFGEDARIISDLALKQMICNVLDNALEASPRGQRLVVTREAGSLVLAVTDMGPGFDPAILQDLGKPYQSTKGRPGGGLGLFLSLKVARTLSGSLVARNLSFGGASVTIRLPLSALAPGEAGHDE
ncbi:ATP-binding protein [Pusillimonas sp. SM2304]|uniref:ATP-binding protein n=1 Tax=Pusillimonas sp. SM2304 TaxID=3073241 RepID=UPI00287574F1|nr:ATP-binding protein [Pusillimonas sp. SM2304]MDS1139165.1 ATP-binding protein [Pusillimonas sp. SM2304]